MNFFPVFFLFIKKIKLRKKTKHALKLILKKNPIKSTHVLQLRAYICAYIFCRIYHIFNFFSLLNLLAL